MAFSFKNIFKQSKLEKTLYSLLNDDTAVFSNFGEDVYLSDFVNNAIDRIATEVSKIQVVSVVQKDVIVRQNDDITRLFRYKPNPLQTTKDFLACCEWLRRKDYNCFIYPSYTEVKGKDGFTYRKYTGFYPLNPIQVTFLIDKNDTWGVEFTFANGEMYTLDYNDIVHLKWRRGKNNVIGGGDDYGQPDTTDLLKSVKILDQVTQGLPKSLEASLKIKGVYTAKSLVDSTKLAKERDNFESHLMTSKSGIVATDLAGTFTPVNIKPTEIDSEVMKYLKAIIRERYGVSDAIISGDYTGEQHAAFYQTCIEDFIIEFEQAMTATVFTQREQDVGHQIRGYYSKIAYMNNKDKIELATLATNTALMSKDEIRNEIFGLSPVGGEYGSKFIQSLNFVDETVANKYQVNEKGSDNDVGQES